MPGGMAMIVMIRARLLTALILRNFKRSHRPDPTSPNDVLYIESGRMIPVRPCHDPTSDRAKFFHRLLRADVLFTDQEQDVFNKLERVIQH